MEKRKTSFACSLLDFFFFLFHSIYSYYFISVYKICCCCCSCCYYFVFIFISFWFSISHTTSVYPHTLHIYTYNNKMFIATGRWYIIFQQFSNCNFIYQTFYLDFYLYLLSLFVCFHVVITIASSCLVYLLSIIK